LERSQSPNLHLSISNLNSNGKETKVTATGTAAVGNEGEEFNIITRAHHAAGATVEGEEAEEEGVIMVAVVVEVGEAAGVEVEAEEVCEGGMARTRYVARL